MAMAAWFAIELKKLKVTLGKMRWLQSAKVEVHDPSSSLPCISGTDIVERMPCKMIDWLCTKRTSMLASDDSTARLFCVTSFRIAFDI